MFVRSMLLTGLLLSAGVSVANEQHPAMQLVKATTEQMVEALEKDRTAIEADPSMLYDLVNKIVLPHFDFERMSRSVLGKYWRKASVEERADFSEQFRQLLVRTYATAMLEYSGQEIEYLPFRAADIDEEVTVATEVQQDAGFPVPVDYFLYRSEDHGWMVYGMSIDGVNLVVNYRSSFATTIRQEGSVGKLIKKLRERNRQALN